MELTKSSILSLTLAATVLAATACGTKERPKTFGLLPRAETSRFSVTERPSLRETATLAENQTEPRVINSKVNLLWVIDNSSSMDPSQKRLRDALDQFARTYMKPQWDIRTAVITSDAYLADPNFTGYLNRPMGKTGVTRREAYPAYGPDYAKLLKHVHDGPIATICSKATASFLGDFTYGPTQCTIRESAVNKGPANCLNPAAGEDSISQCVNTVTNDTIHSNQPILSTTSGMDLQTLIDDFRINVSVSTSGSGYERGLDSLVQFMQDNEGFDNHKATLSPPSTDIQFFRPDSLRLVVFLSDEDDQTIDDTALIADLNKTNGTTVDTYDPEMAYTKSCQARGTQKNPVPALSECVRPGLLADVKTVIKPYFDSFFATLDQNGEQRGFSVISIVTTNLRTATALNADANRSRPGKTTDQDIGQRYIDLAQMTDGSMVMDIMSGRVTWPKGASDQCKANAGVTVANDGHPEISFNCILNNIGQTIKTNVTKHMTQFTLTHAPDSPGDLTVAIAHAAGGETQLAPSQYTLDGTQLTITDQAVIAAAAPGDQVVFYYKMKSFVQDPSITLTKGEPVSPDQVRYSIIHADGSRTELRPDQFTVNGRVVTITDPAVINALTPTDQPEIAYQPKSLN